MGCSLLVIGLAGCASLKSIVWPARKTAGVVGLPAYSGPKARIAVADFDVKTAKADSTIGSSLRKILVSALINSNRFNVVERQAAKADLIITAAVTEFEPGASGGRAGIGGGGGVGSGRLGGLLGASLNKARMALDIRIVDASTSGVLAVSPVQAQASDISGDIMIGPLVNLALAGGGLSAYANTPMDKAIRICIVEAVRYISKTIPAIYYKY